MSYELGDGLESATPAEIRDFYRTNPIQSFGLCGALRNPKDSTGLILYNLPRHFATLLGRLCRACKNIGCPQVPNGVFR